MGETIPDLTAKGKMTIFAILSYDADRRDAHGKVLFFIKDIIRFWLNILPIP